MKVLLSGAIAALLMFSVNAQGKELVADSGFAARSLKNCNTDLRYLNQVIGWQVKWPRQWQGVVSSGVESADDAFNTWSKAPVAIEQAVEKLKLGISSKQMAPRAVVLRVQQQVRDLTSTLTDKNSKYSFNNLDNEKAIKWNSLVRNSIAPAVLAFDSFLEKEYLPASSSNPSLTQIKGGEECFYEAVFSWTTLKLSQNEIEEVGKRLLKASRLQLLATGKQGDTVKSILQQLREQTGSIQTNAKQLITISEQALMRADDQMLVSFSKKANAEFQVTEMPKYMQDSAPAGYYGKAQGKSPARYIINSSRPNERRLMAEVIAFHEGVPGHHLWSTYPRAKPSSGYNSGILEGWALYAEYLADEMGLYSSTFDRQGMITKHLWTSTRLIVEPGLHLRGWSREDAIEFMLENTVMSRTEIEIEVDRYIAMPGQSLSYMLGADLILSERKRAKDILGKSFELAAFHDVILAAGVRTLPKVREDIRAWVRKTKG